MNYSKIKNVYKPGRQWMVQSKSLIQRASKIVRVILGLIAWVNWVRRGHVPQIQSLLKKGRWLRVPTSSDISLELEI